MVWGFLHFGIAWPFYFQFKKHFDFSLLTIASIVPDFETIVLFLLTNGESTRLVLHSFVGSILLGFPVTLFLALVFPKIRKKYPVFFEKNFESSLFNQKTKIISFKSFNSIIFGLLSHVIIDTAMLHEGGKKSPLFFPFSNQTIFLPLFGNATISVITLGTFAAISIAYYSTKILRKKP